MASRTVYISAEKAFKHFDIDDEKLTFDSWEAASGFIREYNEGCDPDDCLDEDAEERVREAIESRSGTSIFEKQLDTIADFIEQSLNHVNRDAVSGTKVVARGRRAGIGVTITPAFVSAAAQIFGGTGLTGDTYSSSLRGVTASAVMNAASTTSDVYGTRSFDRFLDSAFDRWEPDTGSYWELKKVAEKKPRRRR